MGLSAYKEQEESYHDNDKLDKEKLHKKTQCPSCGTESKHMYGNQYKCTEDQDECDTLWYITTDYKVNNANV